MGKLGAVLLGATLLGFAVPAAAQSVGITAAVNQSARGTQPNAAVRTIAIGDNVVFNERIETDTVGLVQILLADGTTFTVGPNSALVIDSFVYDPDANSAQVTATMAKGVLRFIGGATSKTPDGVTINTPVGTVGIRGGVTDINLSPPEGTPVHIDFIFGNEVTLTSGGSVLGRLFQPGYSLAFSPGGGVDVQKTPPEWSSQIQGALAGQPGSSGGASEQPSDETVAESGVPDANSEQALEAIEPPQPLPRLDRAEEIATVLVADAGEDELRELVEDLKEEHEHPVFITRRGGATGVIEVSGLSADLSEEGEYSIFLPARTTPGTSEGGPGRTEVTVDEQGIPVRGVIDVSVCDGCRIVFEGGRAGGTISLVGTEGILLASPAEGGLVSHTEIALPSGTQYCECEFLDWGFWSFSAEFHVGEGHTAGLSVENGVWATGQATSLADIDSLATADHAGAFATYNGHAVGSAIDDYFLGPSRLVSGDMTMQWSFAQRQGEMAITDFDGRDFAGALFMDHGAPGFTGVLASESGGGTLHGGFVNDGSTPAAGVLGDFLLFDEHWSGVGMFMGERGPDVPAH